MTREEAEMLLGKYTEEVEELCGDGQPIMPVSIEDLCAMSNRKAKFRKQIIEAMCKEGCECR